MVFWNIVLIAIALYMIDGTKDLYSLLLSGKVFLFVLVWSAIWFVAGYAQRKRYVRKVNYFIQKNRNISKWRIKRGILEAYVSKMSRLLGILFIITIPCYMYLYMGGIRDLKGWMILAVLLSLAAVFWAVHRTTKCKI